MIEVLLRGNRTEFITHTIQLWIKTKTDTSESTRTKETYEQAITTFRNMTLAAGIDLDGFPPALSIQHMTFDEIEHTLAALGLIAQAWASSAQKEKQRERGISAATYNNRLTIISSFYRFAKDCRLLRMDNPIEQIARRKVQDYVSARPLFKEQIAAALTKIEKNTLVGIRDYALILLLLGTGGVEAKFVCSNGRTCNFTMGESLFIFIVRVAKNSTIRWNPESLVLCWHI